MLYFKHIIVALILLLTAMPAYAERIKDLADIEGVRSNALIGYGIVVGLNGTGDSSGSSPFTVNSIAAMLERLGVNVRNDISKMNPKNIAAVIVTAELPPFARAGQQLDVTVASMGDAKSLRGGQLLLTPLLGGDQKVYAVAQGALSVGGFAAGGAGAGTTKNHPTVGSISNGANVERAAPKSLQIGQEKIIVSLRRPDFTTVRRMQNAINRKLGQGIAKAVDSSTVEVWNPQANAVELIADLEQIRLRTDHPAIVIINERTGTIVMGEEVTIDKVAVAHGNISVTVSESPEASQPNAFAAGETVLLDRTDVAVEEDEAKLVVLPRLTTLASLVSALNAVGATPSDMIAVLQAIKAAGALHADLKVQ